MALDTLVDGTQLDADLTTVANAIRTKGGTSASLSFPSGFVSAINDITTEPVSVEMKDVNFFDYEGTVLYSYTAAEFANLSELPSNPIHTGLTAQGWNWTLSDAKSFVASYGKLNIGQMYITSDGKTRLYIYIIEPSNKTVPLYFSQTVSHFSVEPSSTTTTSKSLKYCRQRLSNSSSTSCGRL